MDTCSSVVLNRSSTAHTDMHRHTNAHTHTHLLFPHRMGCSPAHSWTKAENWEWGFSASASFPTEPSVPPSAGPSVVLGPQVVLLELQVELLAVGGAWWPAHAPLGSSFANPERRSTSLSNRSTSARSFSRAPRWAWTGKTETFACSNCSCAGRRVDRRKDGWREIRERDGLRKVES